MSTLQTADGRMHYIHKKIICDVAREAFAVLPERESLDRAGGVNLNSFDAWRHAEQQKAVGFRSLNQCPAEAYQRLLDHFCAIRSAGLKARGQQSLALT